MLKYPLGILALKEIKHIITKVKSIKNVPTPKTIFVYFFLLAVFLLHFTTHLPCSMGESKKFSLSQ
jgi:hypothetical protein